MEHLTRQLFDFIQSSPTAMHAVETARTMLLAAGFAELPEAGPWETEPGGNYFTTRAMSSLIAFRLPGDGFGAFSVIAPHGDSPCFKVKGNPEMRVEGRYTRLNTEVYGGTVLHNWVDRPLSVAGRLVLRTKTGARAVLTDIDRDLVMIPSLAIHMDREANQGRRLDPQKDTLPLLGGSEADLLTLAAGSAGARKEDVLSYDLYCYARERGTVYGAEEEFLAAPRLDDLECAFSALTAFLQAGPSQNCPVLVLFDNEEIGSRTRQGADSSFLSDVLGRIWRAANATNCYSGAAEDGLIRAVQGGFLLSADNAHAVHPNYPEKADPSSRCYLNGGVCVKHGPRYATDGVTAGVFRAICETAGVPTQEFYNHSAVQGGGTLGVISGSHASFPTVDIGLAQLAMHSPYETGGAKDLGQMVKAMRAFYETKLTWKNDREAVLC